MKYTIYGISLSAIAVLVVAAVMVFSGRNVRKNEMETALNAAVEQSLEQLKSQKGYEIKNRHCRFQPDFAGSGRIRFRAASRYPDSRYRKRGIGCKGYGKLPEYFGAYGNDYLQEIRNYRSIYCGKTLLYRDIPGRRGSLSSVYGLPGRDCGSP